MRFSIGADPELFVFNAKTGQPVPAARIFPHKNIPMPLAEGGRAFYDNVAVEFNIRPAVGCEQWLKNLNAAIQDLKNFLKPKYLLADCASWIMPQETLKDPTAQKFGCRPDYNAYTLRQNTPPDKNTSIRCIGGHIHVGWNEDPKLKWLLTAEGRIRLVKWMDYYFNRAEPASPDEANRRRLYGKAGDHRPTSYGIEYRTPSPAWLNSPNQAKTAYYLTEMAVTRAALGKEPPQQIQKYLQEKYGHERGPLAPTRKAGETICDTWK